MSSRQATVAPEAPKFSPVLEAWDAPAASDLSEIASRVDAPAPADFGEVLAQRPAVGALVPLMLGAGALQCHTAGVIANRSDLRDILWAEP